MLKRSMYRSLFYFPIMVTLLLFSTYIWVPSHLIVPLPMMGFVDNTEGVLPILLVIFCSFILPNRYEIELSLTCGVKTTRLAYYRIIPILVYALAAIFLMLPFYQYTPYDGDTRPHIPIYVPEHFKGYLVVSFLVTTLFFVALFFFFRVLTRNCYVPVVLSLLMESVFYGLCKNIQSGFTDIKYCLVDPFISIYILGDTVPDALAAKYADLSYLVGAWTHNRILFFVLALLLFGATWLLLRREKMHKGFGD